MIEFPEHKASLTLCHNDHLDLYLTVNQAIEQGQYDFAQWVSDEQRQKAIETNDCWTLQWYPDTPVGFHALVAADLDVLLDRSNSIDSK